MAARKKTAESPTLLIEETNTPETAESVVEEPSQTAEPLTLPIEEVNTPETAESVAEEPLQTAESPTLPIEPLAPPSVPLSEVPHDALVHVKLVGAETAVLGGKAILRNEVRTVTYALYLSAKSKHPGKFAVRLPGAARFITEG